MAYGLIRTDALRQASLHGGFAESDRVLLGELALRGRFGLIPENIYIRALPSIKDMSAGSSRTTSRNC